MFNSGFNFSGKSGAYPPCFAGVLTWHKGIVQDDVYLRDSAPFLGSFPFDIVQSACLELDGVDTITMAGHGTLDSYEGTATPSYNNTTLSATSGTLYNLVFSDGTKWRCAETSPTATHIFTDDGLHSGAIVSTDLAAVRAGRQDTYHGNMKYGFGYRQNYIKYSEKFDITPWGYSSILLPVKTDDWWKLEKSGTSANSSLSQTFTLDAVSTTITVIIEVKAGNSSQAGLGLYEGGWSGLSAEILSGAGTLAGSSPIGITGLDNSPTIIKITKNNQTVGVNPLLLYYPDKASSTTAGAYNWIKKVRGFEGVVDPGYTKTEDYTLDGTERLPFLNDHKGNTWNDPESGFKFSDPVDAAIIAMDTDYFFTNTDGEALTVWQRTIEELGAELQTNNHFTTDLAGYSITTNWAWESPGVARHTTGSVVALTSSITLADAVEYEITFTVGGSTAGTVTPYAGSGAAGTARSNGTFTERLTCTTSTDFLLTPTTDFDGWVDNISVRKVDPLVNYNDKYMFGSIAPNHPELFCYATSQTGVCLESALVRVGVGEWLRDQYTGDYIFDQYTGQKIYVEL